MATRRANASRIGAHNEATRVSARANSDQYSTRSVVAGNVFPSTTWTSSTDPPASRVPTASDQSARPI